MNAQNVTPEYVKPVLVELGRVNEFVNQVAESFTGDGGQVIVPGVGKLLLTLPNS